MSQDYGESLFLFPRETGNSNLSDTILRTEASER